MNIFIEDEKSLDGHKVRGIITFDAVYKQFSDAAKIEEIIEEVASTKTTERGGRADDKRSEAAMEDRKKEGYF